jgi:peptide/nickel transport system permease protein
MTSYIIRRSLQGLLVIVIVTFLVFIVIRLLPGDPILIFLAEEQVEQLTQEQIDAARREFGLDKPMMVQYVDWISGLFRGDFGTSIFYRDKVSTLIGERLPVTMHLGFLAFLFSTFCGLSAGVIAALRRGTWIDTVTTSLANLGITIPVFWLGILLIYFFGLKLRLLPIHGYTSPFDDFWLSTRQVIMPVFCLALGSMAGLARQTRSSMLEVLRQDYVRTAWAKGLGERIVVLRHVMKNGLIPVITVIGFQVRMIFGGQVLVETVFNVPGLGRLLVSATFGQDYVIIQGGILIVAILVVVSNLVVDISYAWIDPRIRYG